MTEPLNLRSPLKVQEFLLSQGWKPTEWNSKKVDGKKIRTSPKLTEDSFDSIEGELGQQVALHRKLCSKLSDFEGWFAALREDGTIPTPIGGKAATHRLRHKLVVNVPRVTSFYGREMRECYMAREGYVLVGCDSEGCQLRMLAEELYRYGLGDDEFAAAIVSGDKRAGTDAHSVNMRKINEAMGIELVDRDLAKTLLYGSVFGASVEKVASVLKSTDLKLAARARQAIFDAVPGIVEIKKLLASEWKRNGYLRGLDGRRLYGNSAHSLLVWLMQLDEAISMEMAMCKAEALNRELNAHQLIYYHDELDWESIIGEEKQVAKNLEESIAWSAKYLQMKVPLKGESKIGFNWADIH